jgi:16S rRNA (guanine527-N7)-methyltransferase
MNKLEEGINELRNGLKELGMEPDEKQTGQFMEYYRLLISWNEVINLTAITELKEVVVKHFIDSLAIVKAINPSCDRIIDVGTGAGFPGIPIKLMFPGINMVLLDSLNKRIRFLDEVISKLDLANISTVHGRAEDLGRDSLHRGQYDICVSRAVARLAVLAEYCIPFVKQGGSFVAYKSGNVEEELREAAGAVRLLGADIEKVNEFIIPGTDIRRTLIVIRKTKDTPAKYPRTAGKAAREPLK